MVTLVGTEILQVLPLQTNGQPAAVTEQVTTQQIAALSANGSSGTFITAISTVGAGTLPAAAIFGKIISRGGAQSGTAFTDTTDTAANIITALGASAAIGQAFQYTYDNNTNATATITGGTGVTVSVITTIPANSYARYLVTYTAANTITMVGVEAGMILTTPSGSQYQAATNTTAFTATGAQVGGVSDVTLNLTGALGAGAAFTLPTVTNLSAAVPNGAAALFSYNLRIINSSSGAFSWTVTTNTGWTLSGTMTIAQNTWRDFVVTFTGAAAATLTQVGTGTTS